MSGVNTGRTTPDRTSQVTLPADPITGAPARQTTVTNPGQPIMRPSFLQAFLANLGPALAGGLQAEPGMPFGTGLGGAARGIEEFKQRVFQNSMQQQVQQRENQQAQSAIALQNQQLQDLKASAPIQLKGMQQEQDSKQLQIDLMKSQMQFYANPGSLDSAISTATQNLKDITPDEQAQLDAAKQEAQVKHSFDPINTAVQKISQDRITTTRGAVASPFKDWKAQFTAENGRPPNAKEIQDFQAAPRMMFAPENRIIPVAADPNNPGNITYMKAGQAMNQGVSAPASAGTEAAKAVTKSAIAGPIGDKITAFNTALAHAQLLRQAAKALNNGDMRMLNSISNNAQSQFGDPALTNFNAIANAYNHEITSVISKGHMTDAEVKTGGATMPSDANYKTINAVLSSYEGLAKSKMQQLQQQVEKGQKGQANFPTTAPAHVIQIGSNKYQYKGSGDTADLSNYTKLP